MFEKLQADYQRFLDLEAALADPATAADPAKLTALAKERGNLARLALPFGKLADLEAQVAEAAHLLDGEADPDMRAYAQAELDHLRAQRDQAENALRDLLYDQRTGADRPGLIIEVRAGTGGDEAALFARDLLDMYRRYAEAKGWKFEPLDFVPTELGGFKEATFSISGEGAYRHLQFESGGHRVQRVPETEAQGRIHTSLATVAVLAEPEDIEIDVRPEDLQVDTMTAGGPGGQHQNKTASAVRMTHLPTGTVVVCRDERSQHKNRAKALRILRGRLYDQVRRKADSERAEQRRTLIGSGDRSERIRTYNFPQNRLTDHRIGLTLYNLDRIILGDLDLVTVPLIQHDREAAISGESA